jgi:hypothetical protein
MAEKIEHQAHTGQPPRVGGHYDEDPITDGRVLNPAITWSYPRGNANPKLSDMSKGEDQ